MFGFFKRKKNNWESKKLLTEDEAINACIDELCKHFTLISASFHGDPESYTTSIIERDFEQKTLIIDEFVPKGGNRMLTEKGFVSLKTRLDGTRYAFECQLINATKQDDLLCFVVSYPQQIQSVQRRYSYRVSMSKAQAYGLNIHLFDGNILRAVLNDISVTGLSFRTDNSRLSGLEQDAAISISGLELYEHQLNCTADVKRVAKLQQGHLIAVQFSDLERSQEIVIEHFVSKMQREKPPF